MTKELHVIRTIKVSAKNKGYSIVNTNWSFFDGQYLMKRVFVPVWTVIGLQRSFGCQNGFAARLNMCVNPDIRRLAVRSQAAGEPAGFFKTIND